MREPRPHSGCGADPLPENHLASAARLVPSVRAGLVLLLALVTATFAVEAQNSRSEDDQELMEMVAAWTQREVASIDCPSRSELELVQSFECRGSFADGEAIVAELVFESDGSVRLVAINGVVLPPEEDPEESVVLSKGFGVLYLLLGPVLGFAAIMLLKRLLSLQRGQYVTKPLTPVVNQEVSFPAPGGYTLYQRGPNLGRWDLREVRPSLWDPASSSYLSSSRELLGVRSSGVSRAQRPWFSFIVPRAGTYILYLEGADPEHDDGMQVIFGNASQLKLLALLMATVLSFLGAFGFTMFGLFTLFPQLFG